MKQWEKDKLEEYHTLIRQHDIKMEEMFGLYEYHKHMRDFWEKRLVEFRKSIKEIEE